MAHSFVVYIDESGDEGFKFKTWSPERIKAFFEGVAAVVSAQRDKK